MSDNKDYDEHYDNAMARLDPRVRHCVGELENSSLQSGSYEADWIIVRNALFDLAFELADLRALVKRTAELLAANA